MPDLTTRARFVSDQDAQLFDEMVPHVQRLGKKSGLPFTTSSCLMGYGLFVREKYALRKH